ncbi:hypothetical protein M1N67_01475 [Peptococcaceae bacterium]|nr:hypothetical protein [Peptococcaceae bacterium]
MDTPTAGKAYFEQQNLTNLSVSKSSCQYAKDNAKTSSIAANISLNDLLFIFSS